MNNKMVSLEELAAIMNPVIRGWMNYFSKYSMNETRNALDYVNRTLARWISRRNKSVNRSYKRAISFIQKVAMNNPELFYHWQMGILPR